MSCNSVGVGVESDQLLGDRGVQRGADALPHGRTDDASVRLQICDGAFIALRRARYSHPFKDLLGAEVPQGAVGGDGLVA